MLKYCKTWMAGTSPAMTKLDALVGEHDLSRHHARSQSRDAGIARAIAGEPVARGTDLVPNRPAGAGIVHAIRRGRPRLFPQASAGRAAGLRRRRRLQSDRARR